MVFDVDDDDDVDDGDDSAIDKLINEFVFDPIPLIGVHWSNVQWKKIKYIACHSQPRFGWRKKNVLKMSE